MTLKASSVSAYLKELPEDKREAFLKLRETILLHLPKGFTECIHFGMIGYVVPFETFPSGYHCQPEVELPFLNIGVQKNFIGFYHMGIYGDPILVKWIEKAYKEECKFKLNMGKGCIRLNKNDIPYKMIGELLEKISVEDYIESYTKAISKN